MLPEIDSLSLAEQVAQMFVVRASGHLFDHQIEFPAWEPPAAKLRYWLQDLGVGGVILVGGSAGDLLLRSRQLQSWAQFPLLIAADVEEGVGQRFAGATWFPPPMALSYIEQQSPGQGQHYAELLGNFIARESLAIGINWVLAPVVDVNNNPENPVIDVRSFGETPAMASLLTTAFLQGARQWPVLTCAKHFPGHGDTSVDSHLDLPVLPHSPERLAAIELPPFASAIAAGVDGVMSAHLVIPAWDDSGPATLSPQILTGELRQNLGFEGLIVTDALVMGAIANRYDPLEAPILALEAGADILLMPVDPAGAIESICAAVNSGRISPERIRASVERIWRAKQKIFSPQETPEGGRGEGDSLASSLSELATPAATEAAEGMLRAGLRVGGPLPLPANGEGLRNLIVVDDTLRENFLGHHAPAIAYPKKLGYRPLVFDRDTVPALLAASSHDDPPALLQIFIRGNPFRGTAGLSQAVEKLVANLLEKRQLQALAIYGSPYTLDKFLPDLPEEVPYAFSYGQMPLAQDMVMRSLFEPPK
ncbi:glycoside hydrolase family 3 N-terminal domain-containing protein [[Phormidium] sp. ETS-05]|uniref:glycoside hydrolase family 3 N-terminal domain-containing protein n=1 Tax=[Phormidium] sp. ETS-05 TaxID=222819 RepID=UPI0018EEF09A|nr:glycoside hydrolase family 3 N-terminal domain-containing protein [[Phormidium] sp. ETS-05]